MATPTPFYVLVFFTVVASCNGLVVLPEGATPPPAVFAYGDSIVDQGNNNGLHTLIKANFPPYGKDFPGGPTGRFCNGRTPPDLIAEELGIKSYVPAYLDPKLTQQDQLTGVSFASGASGFDPETSQTALVIPLAKQLEYVKEYKAKVSAAVGPERTNQIMSDSLHIVAAGSDDLANNYFGIGDRRLHYDIESYADLMVTSASSFAKDLYALGATKIGFFSLPPVGCLPIQRTLSGGLKRDCNEERNQAAQLVNSKLSAALDSLIQTLPQSRVVYIDIYNPLLDLIQNHQQYGFEVNDTGCCGTGLVEVLILCGVSGTCPDASKYVFWDSYHPTERGYKMILDQILQGYTNKFF